MPRLLSFKGITGDTLYGLDKYISVLLSSCFFLYFASKSKPEIISLIGMNQALVSVFLVFSLQSFDPIIQKDLVESPNCSGRILGTVFALKLTSSTIFFIFLFSFVSLLKLNNSIVLIIMSSAVLFKSMVFVSGYLIANSHSFLYFTFGFLGSLLSFFIKLSLFELYGDNELLVGLIFSIDFLILSFLYWALFLNKFKVGLYFDIDYLKVMIRKGKYLFFSSCFLVLYGKFDQLVIGFFFPYEISSSYFVSLRILGVFIISGSVVGISYISKIDKGSEFYHGELKKMLNSSIVIGLAMMIIHLFASHFLLHFFYFEYYADSMIYSLLLTPVIFFSCTLPSINRVLIYEGKERIIFFRDISLLVFNIALTFSTLSILGVYAVIFSTVSSLFLGGLGIFVCNKKVRSLFVRIYAH